MNAAPGCRDTHDVRSTRYGLPLLALRVNYFKAPMKITDDQIRALICQCNETRPCLTHWSTNQMARKALGYAVQSSTRGPTKAEQREARVGCATLLAGKS